jgi:hypothetical protein
MFRQLDEVGTDPITGAMERRAAGQHRSKRRPIAREPAQRVAQVQLGADPPLTPGMGGHVAEPAHAADGTERHHHLVRGRLRKQEPIRPYLPHGTR